MSVLSSFRGSARLRDAALRARVLSPCTLRAYWFTGFPNFGDQSSASVIEWATGVPVTWVKPSHKGKVLGVGSILQHALAPRDHVWGSGLIRDRKIVPPPAVTFLAVRGPLTRRNLAADVPEIYGDPAILLPNFHNRPVEKRYSVGIVPHYRDYSAVVEDDPAIMVINVAQPWKKVVDAIRSCDLIVSSSLHGLIVAEAYGIPAAWVRISGQLKGSSFKFHDYLLATGREPISPVEWTKGLAQALHSPLPPMVFQPEPLIAAATQLRATLPAFCRSEGRRTL